MRLGNHSLALNPLLNLLSVSSCSVSEGSFTAPDAVQVVVCALQLVPAMKMRIWVQRHRALVLWPHMLCVHLHGSNAAINRSIFSRCSAVVETPLSVPLTASSKFCFKAATLAILVLLSLSVVVFCGQNWQVLNNSSKKCKTIKRCKTIQWAVLEGDSR